MGLSLCTQEFEFTLASESPNHAILMNNASGGGEDTSRSKHRRNSMENTLNLV